MRARSEPYFTARQSFYMTSFTTKNQLKDENQKLVEKYFSDVGDINYPSLLFFQIDNEKILDTLIVELHEKKQE